VKCSVGTPYISAKKVYLNNKPIDRYTLQYGYKIKENEVGCYSEQSFYGKRVTLEVTYEVPKQHVILNNYTHYLFSENHLFIETLKSKGLKGEDIKQDIPKNERVKVNIITGQIEARTLNPILFIFGLSVIPIVVWFIFGREKQFVVPNILHRPPLNPEGKEEPYWKYGLIYHNLKMSKEVLAAILFSLKLKGYIHEIEKVSNSKVRFYLNKKDLPDDFAERKILELLISNKVKEENNLIISEIDEYSSVKVKQTFNEIESQVRQMVDLWGSALQCGIYFLIFLILFYLRFSFPLMAISFVYFILSVLYTSFDLYLFGRFKGKYYKEYLEILSFRRLLSDFAKLSKYGPEDYNMWKKWLLIGIALGVADKVLKVMRKKGFYIPEDCRRYYTPAGIFYEISTINFRGSSGGSYIGGSIGSGGGFGGGGFGGR
jgi:uncharacterized membrane protein